MENKNFEYIYNKVSQEASSELEAARKKAKKTYLISGAIGILIMLILGIFTKSFNFSFIIIALIIGGVINKFTSNYTLIFKEKVIKSFVKYYDENLDFHATNSRNSFNYDNAEFEGYDKFYSEDFITGTINNTCNITMCEVKTTNESIDSDGHKHTTTVFHGLFADVKSPKSFTVPVTIRSDAGIIGNIFKSRKKLQMDSSEFEKSFDVFSENKIVAMQILTSDIMNLLLDFKSKYKISFEITLKEGHIYVRFKTGSMFEPQIFKTALDKPTLEKCFNIINFTFDLSVLLNNTVNETEI